MQDHPESWLDARLGTVDGWSDATPSSAVVVDSDDALDAVLAQPGGLTDLEGAVVADDSTWLASAAVGADPSAGGEIAVSVADLAEVAASAIPIDAADLDTAVTLGLRDLDDTDDEAAPGIVDPFDVFLAESDHVENDEALAVEAAATADVDEHESDPVVPAEPAPALDAEDELDDAVESGSADEEPSVPVATDAAETPTGDSIPATGFAPARLDAFDAFGDEPVHDHVGHGDDRGEPEAAPHDHDPHLDDFE